MSRREGLLLLALAGIVSAAVWCAGGCGDEGGATSASSVPVTSVTPTRMSSATTGTSTGTVIYLSPEVREYLEGVAAWADEWGGPARDWQEAINALDDSRPTAEQVRDVEAALAGARTLVERLHAVTAPVAARESHLRFVETVDEMLSAIEEASAALIASDDAATAVALKKMEGASARLKSVMADWQSMLVGTLPPR